MLHIGLYVVLTLIHDISYQWFDLITITKGRLQCIIYMGPQYS